VHAPGIRGRLRSTQRLLIKEIGAFGVVGAISFVLDVGLFQVLYAHVGMEAVIAKVLSTAVAMTLAYVGHRYWSFSHRAHTQPVRQSAVFALINLLTLALGAAVIWFVRYPLGQESVLVIQLANLISIVLGTVIRYLGYRRWVFTAPADSRPLPA
jgi:putative flippase GtrA